MTLSNTPNIPVIPTLTEQSTKVVPAQTNTTTLAPVTPTTWFIVYWFSIGLPWGVIKILGLTIWTMLKIGGRTLAFVVWALFYALPVSLWLFIARHRQARQQGVKAMRDNR